jgi:hypothetical protein
MLIAGGATDVSPGRKGVLKKSQAGMPVLKTKSTKDYSTPPQALG